MHTHTHKHTHTHTNTHTHTHKHTHTHTHTYTHTQPYLQIEEVFCDELKLRTQHIYTWSMLFTNASYTHTHNSLFERSQRLLKVMSLITNRTTADSSTK